MLISLPISPFFIAVFNILAIRGITRTIFYVSEIVWRICRHWTEGESGDIRMDREYH